MADIVINIDAFQCSPPNIGDTYRLTTATGYLFNYDWLGDLYISYGLSATVQLFYSGDGAPFTEYTSNLPNTAIDYLVDLPINFDQVDFRIIFRVENGTVCEYIFNIPYSSLIIL